ncbi:MAG TPA: hypothetical protein VMF89_24790, partial [Polyangiales bacterium]|nr:hypothetical protein [Polyangiales bacterium]
MAFALLANSVAAQDALSSPDAAVEPPVEQAADAGVDGAVELLEEPAQAQAVEVTQATPPPEPDE